MVFCETRKMPGARDKVQRSVVALTAVEAQVGAKVQTMEQCQEELGGWNFSQGADAVKRRIGDWTQFWLLVVS